MSRSPTKCSDVSEHSVHWRLRGSCRNDRFSTCSRVDPDRQLVGHDHRLVAARRRRGRRATAAIIRADDLLVGLAPRRLERVPQVPPGRRACAARRRRRRSVLPSNMLVDSMTRSSVTISSPRAVGQRLRGLLGPLQRRDPQVGDVAVADRRRRPARPSAGRGRRGGSRAAGRRARPRGLCTSPWRSRWTIVSVGLAHASSSVGRGGRGAGRGGQGVEHGLDGAVVVGGGQEPASNADGGR